MRIPLEWLREYVDVGVEAPALAHALTMFGTKIESIEAPGPGWSDVYIGKVLECGPHPNADKLRLCRVDVGGERLQVVCGAPNVRTGLTVAVAKVGARLPGDVKIRRTKIRGETSEGMICSARELGLGSDTGGILELEATLTSGERFMAEAADVVLEAEITPNRPDCLSLVGIAREVAAVYERALRRPPVWDGRPARPAAVAVDIESAADCGRYIGRVLRNLRVGPSPEWMQRRLRALGHEPINNVVDITNYVLFETGQPLHAFDLGALRGARIVVRRARSGERLRTLDGIDRPLDASMLVIADAEHAVAIAGVMGGAESAVRESTRDILLEAAFFDPRVVRSTRRQLRLESEASYRFERGADIEAARWAADRATLLFVELAGAEVSECDADNYPARRPAATLRLRPERCTRIIGVELDATTIAALLRRLELPARVDGPHVVMDVPAFRRDLGGEIDLVEEVARVYGYENIPEDVLPPAPLRPQPQAMDVLMRRLRDIVVGMGYFDIRTSAFMDRRDPDRLRLVAEDARRQFVPVRNPLVSSLDTLRTTALPGAMRVLRHNIHHGQESVRLVQIDRVFLNVPGPNPGLPLERERLLGLVCGTAQPRAWDSARAYDYYDLKGDIECLLRQLGIDSEWAHGYTEPFWDSTASALISGTYGTLGTAGQLRPEVAQAFDVEGPVYGFDFDIEALLRHVPRDRQVQVLPRFPAVKRDLSLVVPRRVAYADVRRVVAQAGGRQLEHIECFDVFEDPALGTEAHVIGLRLRFRSPTATLTDAAVQPCIERIMSDLGSVLQVQLRAS